MDISLPLSFIVHIPPSEKEGEKPLYAEGQGGALLTTRADGEKTHTVSPPSFAHSIRLDAALSQVFPSLGVRGRRRLWEWCVIRVNETPRAFGFMVREGDTISITAKDDAGETDKAPQEGTFGKSKLPKNARTAPKSTHCSKEIAYNRAPHNRTLHCRGAGSVLPEDRENREGCVGKADASRVQENVAWNGIQLVAISKDFLVFYKPCGLHTAHLAGSCTPSLEASLPAFMQCYGHRLDEVCLHQGGDTPYAGHTQIENGARQSIKQQDASQALPRLVTRLDKETSGLVLAARSAQAEKQFRRWESLGQVHKTYVAIVEGEGNGNEGIVTSALNMEKRQKTAVLSSVGEETRWTRYTKLAAVQEVSAPLQPFNDACLHSITHAEHGQGQRCEQGYEQGHEYEQGCEYEHGCEYEQRQGQPWKHEQKQGQVKKEEGREQGQGSRQSEELWQGQEGGCSQCMADLGNVHEKNREQRSCRELIGQLFREGSSTSLSCERGTAPLLYAKNAMLPDEMLLQGHQDISLSLQEGCSYSLLKVCIQRGARHQIRAHLSSIGLPLVGDTLYGRARKVDKGEVLPNSPYSDGLVSSPTSSSPTSSSYSFSADEGDEAMSSHKGFFLHYGRLSMPGLTAWVLPDAHWDRWKIGKG